MTRPGTQIISRDSAPPRGAPTDTGTWFVAGFTTKGDHENAIEINGMNDYIELLGERTAATATLYDAAETFFKEGGTSMFVGRVVGPTPVAATANLWDASGSTAPGDVALAVTAKSVGEWGNSLNVAVTAGDNAGEFKIVVTHDDDGDLETSPSLTDRDAAVAWAEESDYIDIALGASAEDPRVNAAQGLTGGDDDDASIADAQWEAALDLFTRDLGPGQVSMPGRTTGQAHQDLLDHAEANDRVAILDLADTATKATLTAATAAARAAAEGRYGGAFAPWDIVPGVLPGTTRTVPPSARVAGTIARNDNAGESPNQPAAGNMGIARYATGVTQSWSDSDREDLNEAGVNVSRSLYGQVKTYGYRTLVDAETDPVWLNLANAREYMKIAAEANAIAERYVFQQIDGRGLKIAQFEGDLRGMLMAEYRANALYGNTPDEAFNVDVGSTVNTPTSIANGELRAVIGVKLSPYAELVIVEIAKVAITEAL